MSEETHYGLVWTRINGHIKTTVCGYDASVSYEGGSWGWDISYNGMPVKAHNESEPPMSEKKAMFEVHRALTYIISPD